MVDADPSPRRRSKRQVGILAGRERSPLAFVLLALLGILALAWFALSRFL